MTRKLSRAKFMETLLGLGATLVGASWAASFFDRSEPLRPPPPAPPAPSSPAPTPTPAAQTPPPEAAPERPDAPPAGADARGNVPGKYYVSDACIKCNACVVEAPDHFRHDKGRDTYHVYKQPATPAEEELCRSAASSCPTDAIETRA